MATQNPHHRLKSLHVGIIGSGIGGASAAIAISQSGARVTVLEAASSLTEIGAGIQMTPNVSRLLQKWKVDDVIGSNLVRHRGFNIRRRDGSVVGRTDSNRIEKELGHPWWVVHRHHLLTGLVEVARRNAVTIRTSSRVESVEHEREDGRAGVKTEKGEEYEFDLLIGADGLNSIVRGTLFPGVEPGAPTNNASYRAVMPMQLLRDDPELEPLSRLSMDVWIGPNGYVIAYPISGGEVFNLVFSHHRPNRLYGTEKVEFEDLLEEYKDYEPRLQKLFRMIDTTQIQRWPLLQTGPLESWSSRRKNVVLMGDAAHSMVNHMAQGAATSMEDGAFLARCLEVCMQGQISLGDAVEIYEIGRMPKARMKQQVSFLNAAIWTLPDGALADARDRAMVPELKGEMVIRSPNLYNDPVTVLEVYGYDVDEHAEREIADWLRGGRKERHAQMKNGVEIDERSKVERWRADRTMNWFLPKGLDWRPVKEGAMEVRTGFDKSSRL